MTNRNRFDCLSQVRRMWGKYSGPFGWYNDIVTEFGEKLAHECRRQVMREMGR